MLNRATNVVIAQRGAGKEPFDGPISLSAIISARATAPPFRFAHCSTSATERCYAKAEETSSEKRLLFREKIHVNIRRCGWIPKS